MTGADVIKWFDASPNCYMVLDRELRFIAANTAYLEVTGSTAEQLLGRNLFDMFPNESEDPSNEPRRLLEASLKKVLATGKRDIIAYIPYRVGRTPGAAPELRIWSATHTPLLDHNGEVEAILQYTEDVTSLYAAPSAVNVLSRAEQVQRDYVELSERLRGLVATLDQAPGFMAVLRGPEHVFAFVNRAYDTLIGGREVVGLGVREAMPELAGQGYFAILDRVYANREPFLGRGMQLELSKPDGERHEIYVDFVYQPILGPDGETYGVLVQGHDITEQVRTSRHSQFRTLASEHIASAGDDIEAALVNVARSAVQTVADWALVDLFDEEEGRRLVAAHADPSHTAEAAALMQSPLPSAIPWGHPLHLRSRPRVTPRLTPQLLREVFGSAPHLELVQRLGLKSMLSVPLCHRERLYGVLVLLTAQSRRRYDESDVPPMVELAGVLATAFDNMLLARERQELLRTAEEARARAETANRAKDDFLAMLGHELRNPLAPIVTAIDLLRACERAPERELSIIERQAHHLVRLVDDMLDVSRIVHGKLELRRASVAVATFVRRAVEMASPVVEQREHDLAIAWGSPEATVYGDEARLAQVVANLLTNAARHTPAGGHISLDTRLEGEEVLIRVRDDGVGIDANTLPRIFDMFVQGPQTVERAQGGLGLGLTLVERLVELHGGSVEAHSAGAGKGSEFAVRLPAHRNALGAELHAREPETGDAAVESRVLVVDDNEDAAELLAALLARSGHVVHVCHDGHTALAHVLEARPDVAIVDLGLPGMDGLELARRVRKELGARAPRLLALSGYGSAEDKHNSKLAGFEAHLTKPANARVLLDALRTDTRDKA